MPNHACDSSQMCTNNGANGDGCTMGSQCTTGICNNFHCQGNAGSGEPCGTNPDCANFQCNGMHLCN